MNIALVAPPFIPVPPPRYGGTELFVAHLARGLHASGHRVVVYANGESELPCEVRWLHPTAQWPIVDTERARTLQLEHLSWAVGDARDADFDVVHFNDALALHFTRFLDAAIIMTLHHPREPALSDLYLRHPEAQYVAISAAQATHEPMPDVCVIHHGVDFRDYALSLERSDYLCFIGRIAPCKGLRQAIEVAHRADLPLKIAGEIQPVFVDYWEAEIKPRIDGRRVEYVGEADLAAKTALLAGARALLFPIQWDEPFGLVMIEAMACGTPVLAFGRGSVPEVVEDGLTGWICTDVEQMARIARSATIDAVTCRRRAYERFSVDRMARDYAQLYARLERGSPAAA